MSGRSRKQTWMNMSNYSAICSVNDKYYYNYNRKVMNNIFYVYAYLREDSTPYYIGKGSNDRAWKSHIRTNGTNLLPKDKDKIVILKNLLSEEEAYDYESELIEQYGRKDLGTGILHNLTDGGRGNEAGYKHNENAIEKLRSAGKLSAKQRIENGTHNFVNNPPKVNLGGVVTKKLIDSGKHNLLKRPDGTSVASDRVANGSHHFVNSEWKKKHGIEHSKWMNEQVKNGEAFFVKNNPARVKVSCIHCKKETNLMGLGRFHKHYKETNE